MQYYVPALDGLRAIAVVAVVLFHSRGLSGGFVGVDLFFVLSAFLITSILVKSPDLKRFYLRRAFRLMPALLFLLAAYLIVAPLVWNNHPHGRDALLTGLYVSDYSYTFWKQPLYLQHTWSLGVEEKFYLVWPLVLVPLLKARKPLLWLGGAYVLAMLWRSSFSEWDAYYYRFDTRLTGLILGAMLFFALPYLKPRPWMAGAASVVLLAVFLTGNILRASAFIPLAELAAAVLIACAVTGNAGSLLSAPILAWLGKLSYGIYLWHFPIAYAIRDDLAFIPTAAATLALSIGVAALSFCTVEAWGRRLRDRVEGRRAVPALMLGREPVR